jgi:hypothetical protein
MAYDIFGSSPTLEFFKNLSREKSQIFEFSKCYNC